MRDWEAIQAYINNEGEFKSNYYLTNIFLYVSKHLNMMGALDKDLFKEKYQKLISKVESLYPAGQPLATIKIEDINKMLPVEKVSELINSDRKLIIAGDDRLLGQLPKGNWIGGSIPYFMTNNGGIQTKEFLFITDITDLIQDFKIKVYDEKDIDQIPNDYYEDGFSYILIPGFSDVLTKFAIEVEHNLNFFDTPLVGWVTGISLEDLENYYPIVINGLELKKYNNKIVIFHAKLPEKLFARLEIINIFERGDGDTIIFTNEGFVQYQCYINGNTDVIFADYIRQNKIDTRLPLVADYNGVNINVSINKVSDIFVETYAPVRPGTPYKFAKPLQNYRFSFLNTIPANNKGTISSFNCILNYLYGELENTKLPYQGPFTFGEIAYLLLNQTLVNLKICQLKD